MSGQQTVSRVTQLSFGGIDFSASVQITADLILSAIVSVPVAWAGTLSTRTDADTGILTMTSASHLITTGAKLDLYWSGGYRRGMVVGTVSGVTVPIDIGTGGTGDNLPVVTTAIVACVPVRREIAFLNASCAIIGVTNDAESVFSFVEADTTTVTLAAHTTPASTGAFASYSWDSSSGVTSPFSATATFYVYMSHADVAAAHVMRAAALTN